MIQIIPSEARYIAEHGWLTTRFSFSFAEYYDPNNLKFGALRVFNDDVIQPGKGFGMHPHANMEIMSYVLEGTLEHRDSMGNHGFLRAGEVQRMTAGTGIYHSEFNGSDREPVHLLQIWFEPDRKGLEPSWEQRSFPKAERMNRLLPVVSGKPVGDALAIHQDLTVYLSHLEEGKTLTYSQEAGRRMYVFVIDGNLTLNEAHSLAKGDSARITGVSELHIAATSGAELMFMDLA